MSTRIIFGAAALGRVSQDVADQALEVLLKHERIQHWTKNGAQLSDTVKRLVDSNPVVAAPVA